MSTSPNKGYNLQATGTNFGLWGTILNTNYSTIDLNFGGLLVKDVSGNSNITVSSTNAENVYHRLTGAITGDIKYILPNAGSFYIIENSTTGAFAITIVSDAAGGGILIPQGNTTIVFVDSSATTVKAAINYLGGILPVSSGGTGIASFSIGDLLYANTTTTLSKLSDVVTGNALISGGVNTPPSWGKVDLTLCVTGNLPTSNLNGGSGASGTTFWCGDGTWKAAGGGGGSVTSVNGQTGVVVLTKTDISLGNVQNVDQTVATNLTSGTVATARLASGTADSTTFLRGDQTWSTAIIPTTQGAVGTYINGFKATAGNIAEGATIAGSSLQTASISATAGFSTTGSSTPSGTWRVMSGTLVSNAGGSGTAPLCLRIA